MYQYHRSVARNVRYTDDAASAPLADDEVLAELFNDVVSFRDERTSLIRMHVDTVVVGLHSRVTRSHSWRQSSLHPHVRRLIELTLFLLALPVKSSCRQEYEQSDCMS